MLLKYILVQTESFKKLILISFAASMVAGHHQQIQWNNEFKRFAFQHDWSLVKRKSKKLKKLVKQHKQDRDVIEQYLKKAEFYTEKQKSCVKFLTMGTVALLGATYKQILPTEWMAVGWLNFLLMCYLYDVHTTKSNLYRKVRKILDY